MAERYSRSAALTVLNIGDFTLTSISSHSRDTYSGRYRYYTCATCAQRGKSACKGRSIPMDRLDTLVMDQLTECLLTPERVRIILGNLLERQAARSEDHAHRVIGVNNKVADAEGRLSRLYQAIETGLADLANYP